MRNLNYLTGILSPQEELQNISMTQAINSLPDDHFVVAILNHGTTQLEKPQQKTTTIEAVVENLHRLFMDKVFKYKTIFIKIMIHLKKISFLEQNHHKREDNKKLKKMIMIKNGDQLRIETEFKKQTIIKILQNIKSITKNQNKNLIKNHQVQLFIQHFKNLEKRKKIKKFKDFIISQRVRNETQILFY